MKKTLISLAALLTLFFPATTFAALSSGLVGYYQMQGNSNTSVGTVNLTDTSVTYNSSYGIIGEGASYVGSSGHYSCIAAPSAYNNSNFSVSGWWNPQATPSFAGLVTYEYGTPSGAYSFIVLARTTTGISFDTGSSGSQQNALNITVPTITTSKWYFYVATYDDTSKTLTFYWNGTQVAQTTGTYNIAYTTGGNFCIGNNKDSDPANGYEDEIGLWNRVLTSTEVTNLYNAGAGCAYPMTNDCVAKKFGWWHFFFGIF